MIDRILGLMAFICLLLRYSELADQASWAHMQLVFNKVFTD